MSRGTVAGLNLKKLQHGPHCTLHYRQLTERPVLRAAHPRYLRAAAAARRRMNQGALPQSVVYDLARIANGGEIPEADESEG